MIKLIKWIFNLTHQQPKYQDVPWLSRKGLVVPPPAQEEYDEEGVMNE